jgi:hypothetical protein
MATPASTKEPIVGDFDEKSGQNGTPNARKRRSLRLPQPAGPEACAGTSLRVEMPQRGALESLSAIVFGGTHRADLAFAGEGL